jgi:hypothetical protein
MPGQIGIPCTRYRRHRQLSPEAVPAGGTIPCVGTGQAGAPSRALAAPDAAARSLSSGCWGAITGALPSCRGRHGVPSPRCAAATRRYGCCLTGGKFGVTRRAARTQRTASRLDGHPGRHTPSCGLAGSCLAPVRRRDSRSRERLSLCSGLERAGRPRRPLTVWCRDALATPGLGYAPASLERNPGYR